MVSVLDDSKPSVCSETGIIVFITETLAEQKLLGKGQFPAKCRNTQLEIEATAITVLNVITPI